MDKLSNAFSVLDVDADDDRVNAVEASAPSQNGPNSSVLAVAATQNMESTRTSKIVAWIGDNTSRKSKRKDNGSNHKGKKEEAATTVVQEYKQALVWIDLEMTGLNVETDRILEIACIITDGRLTKSTEVLGHVGINGKAKFVQGPDLVIHQSKECMDGMGEWCTDHHAASGLTKKVLHSTISEKEAEKKVIDFVKENIGTQTALLAGNSVYVDLMFLKKYMPELAAMFPHVLVDVSSVKSLCIRWYPRENKKAPTKENKHRALDDIRESIRELKFYKDNIFKPNSRQ